VAVIHQTTLVDDKLALLNRWLPEQDWYAADPSGPSLARVGGFRLDDPAGRVAIEELIQGRAQAQAQSQSNTPDATVRTVPAAAAPGQAVSISFARRLSPAADGAALPGVGEVTGPWTAPDGALVRSLFATARPVID
jgi:hypothetical protein